MRIGDRVVVVKDCSPFFKKFDHGKIVSLDDMGVLVQWDSRTVQHWVRNAEYIIPEEILYRKYKKATQPATTKKEEPMSITASEKIRENRWDILERINGLCDSKDVAKSIMRDIDSLCVLTTLVTTETLLECLHCKLEDGE